MRTVSAAGRGLRRPAVRHPALRQQPTAVPDAVSGVERPEPRPVPGGRQHIRRAHEGPGLVQFHHRARHAEGLEQQAKRQRVVVQARRHVSAQRLGQDVGAAARVAPFASGRRRQRPCRREGTARMLGEQHLQKIAEGTLVAFVEVDAARHAQEMLVGHCAVRIAGRAPAGDAHRLADLERAAQRKRADDAIEDALGHGPAGEKRRRVESGGVALGEQFSVAEDDHGPGGGRAIGPALGERLVEQALQGGDGRGAREIRRGGHHRRRRERRERIARRDDQRATVAGPVLRLARHAPEPGRLHPALPAVDRPNDALEHRRGPHRRQVALGHLRGCAPPDENPRAQLLGVEAGADPREAPHPDTGPDGEGEGDERGAGDEHAMAWAECHGTRLYAGMGNAGRAAPRHRPETV